MNRGFKAPNYDEGSFNCPHCGAFSGQNWSWVWTRFDDDYDHETLEPWALAQCAACDKISLWCAKEIVYPTIGSATPPHPDMPDEVASIYNEAKEISGQSPRGAAALLRLALQVLCKELGGKGKNINDDIASFVKKGLPVEVQKALDVVRVVGNNAVHPGEIDLKDTPEIAGKLFDLINFIVQDRITRPRELEALYETIPESQRKAIQKRDGKSNPE